MPAILLVLLLAARISFAGGVRVVESGAKTEFADLIYRLIERLSIAGWTTEPEICQSTRVFKY